MTALKLLSDADRKEQLSVAYLWAIASHAGYSISTRNLDRDSVDLAVHGKGFRFPQINFQLKATSNPNWQNAGSELAFQLKKKNYDELRADRICPAYLIVFELPQSEVDWLSMNSSELILQRCAWWADLAGLPEISTQSTTIKIPNSQLFNLESLTDLMQQADT